MNIFISAFTGGSSTPEVKQENPEYWARIYSQVNVQGTLKSPSTADFCSDKKVVDLGENRYQVTSCVDSQNGFGAMIRSNWQITMKYDGTDADEQKSWNVEKIIFDGEVIYQQ